MKKRKFVNLALVLSLLLVALPLQARAAEIEWVPIQSGQTVSGSVSNSMGKYFNEYYVITANYDGELILDIDFTNEINIFVLNEDGKPFAPTKVQTNSLRHHFGTTTNSNCYLLAGEATATLTYKVQADNYYIMIQNSFMSAAFDLTVTTPLQAVATATPTYSTVLVNGQNVAFDAYNINGNNYFKLRDLAKVLSGTGKQFEVTWDGEKNAINMIAGEPYTVIGGEMEPGDGTEKTARLNTATIYLDGSAVRIGAYNINGNNYFKLRDIGSTFDFDVTWDGARNTIVIDTTQGYTPD